MTTLMCIQTYQNMWILYQNIGPTSLQQAAVIAINDMQNNNDVGSLIGISAWRNPNPTLPFNPINLTCHSFLQLIIEETTFKPNLLDSNHQNSSNLIHHNIQRLRLDPVAWKMSPTRLMCDAFICNAILNSPFPFIRAKTFWLVQS